MALTSRRFSFTKNVATAIEILAYTADVDAFIASSSIRRSTPSAVDLIFLVEPIPSQLVHIS